jgi:hypothetical protein
MSSRTVTFDPPRGPVALALGAAVLAVGLSSFGPLALPVGLVALVLLAVGIRRGTPTLIHAGGGLLVVTVLLAGVGGVPPIPTLLAGVLAVLVWDASTDTVVCTGYDTDGRSVLARTSSVGVGALLAAIWCYATYRLAAGGRPTVALLALVVGALTLVGSLSDSR